MPPPQPTSSTFLPARPACWSIQLAQQRHAADPDVADAIAAGGVDELRNGIVERLLGEAAEVDGGQVGGLAHFQRTQAALQPQGAGAVEGRHAQGAMGVEGGGRAGDGLGQQGGGAGLAEQIEIVVAGRAVGADGDVHAGLPEPLHRAEAAGQLEIGFGTVDDMAVGLDQVFQVLVVHLGHVHRLEARPEQAQAAQPAERPLTGLLQGLLHLEGGLVHVHLDRCLQLLGQHQDLFELGVGHGIGRMGAEGHADALVQLHVVEQF
jgi:hypothetical protein